MDHFLVRERHLIFLLFSSSSVFFSEEFFKKAFPFFCFFFRFFFLFSLSVNSKVFFRVRSFFVCCSVSVLFFHQRERERERKEVKFLSFHSLFITPTRNFFKSKNQTQQQQQHNSYKYLYRHLVVQTPHYHRLLNDKRR